MKFISRDKKQDLEVWALFNPDTDGWMLFADEDAVAYIGEADNLAHAHQLAKLWFEDRASY
jgi:hypothetical protein